MNNVNEQDKDEQRQEKIEALKQELAEKQSVEQSRFDDVKAKAAALKKEQEQKDDANKSLKQTADSQSSIATSFGNANPSWIIKFLQQNLEQMLSLFMVNMMPYVVLILIIVLIFAGLGALFGGGGGGGGRGGGGGGGSNRYEATQKVGIFTRIWRFIASFFTPGYNILMMFRKLNPSNKQVGIPRSTISSGRCDGVAWVEDPSDEGKRGTCTNPNVPKDIVWNIKKSKNSEYASLPSSMKKRYDDSTIVIPWHTTQEASFYVPDCEKAYFKEQCRIVQNSTCTDAETRVGTSCCKKADVLVENGTTCALKEVVRDYSYPKTKGTVVRTNRKETKILDMLSVLTGAKIKPQDGE
jgi:hypothetical protein